MYITESTTANIKPQAQVAVVSPQQLYLDALQRLLRSPAYTIIGAGRTLEEALQGKSLDSPLSLVVYNLDTDDEVEEHLGNIKSAHARFPLARSVILADCRRTSTKLMVIQAGIEAILSRDISIDMLRSSLELVLLGKCIVPAELAGPLLRQDRGIAEPSIPPQLPPPEVLPKPGARDSALLSSREHQILQCLINGLTNKAIARDLDISEATVKVHVKALLRKTRLANRTQAAIWALNNAPESKLLAVPEAGEVSAQSWLTNGQDTGRSQPLAAGPREADGAHPWREHEPRHASLVTGTKPQDDDAPATAHGFLIVDDVP